jgi:hypothetical protein
MIICTFNILIAALGELYKNNMKNPTWLAAVCR